jgi:hypothetical protein
MQSIYNYIDIPVTHHVSRVYNVAAVLWSQFVVATYDAISMLSVLYFYINIFRSMSAVPNMAVFCSLLMSCFPGMLLR